MRSQLAFSHEIRTYVFRGKKLDPPKPGTYDPSWTPPTHQVFAVKIYIDGLWLIELNGAVVKTGDGGTRSRCGAKAIIEEHCQVFLRDCD